MSLRPAVLASLFALSGAMGTAAPPAIGFDDMPAAAGQAAADPDPDPWPRDDASAEGVEDMIRDQQHVIRNALPDARRGDDPAGPPGEERLRRTLRKVGGSSIMLRMLKVPLDR